MKLHLPLSLRSALLAACVLCCVAPAAGDNTWVYDQSNLPGLDSGDKIKVYTSDDQAAPIKAVIVDDYYWLKGNKPIRQDDTVAITREHPGSATFTDASGNEYTLYNRLYFNYAVGYKPSVTVTATSHTDSDGNVTWGHAIYEQVEILDEHFSGKDEDLTFQCSRFDNEGHLTNPGVWIFSAQKYCEQTGGVSYVGYGDILVSDSRQQWFLDKVTGIQKDEDGNAILDENENAIPIWTREEHELNSTDGIVKKGSAFNIGFNLSVENSDSFTFTRGYGRNGAFANGSCDISFDRVASVNFTNNEAIDSGGLLYGIGWNLSVTNAENVTFSGNSSAKSAIGHAYFDNNNKERAEFTLNLITGTALFENNSGEELFRTVDSTFSKVHELIFRDNQTRIWRGYNTTYTVKIHDCGTVLFEGNGSEGYSGAIAANSSDAANVSFKNLGGLTFRNNKATRYLFDSPVELLFDEIGSVSFIGNSSANGAVLGTNMVFDHIDQSFSIEGSEALREGSAQSYSYGALFSGNNTGTLTVNGRENGRAESFSVSDNEATGGFSRGLANLGFIVNRFDKVHFDINVISSTTDLRRALGKLNLTDVGTVTIKGNRADSTGAVGSLVSDESTISNFERLEISGNQLGSEENSQSEMKYGLLDDLTVTGQDQGSTVEIRGNTMRGNLSKADSSILTISRVDSLKILSNTSFASGDAAYAFASQLVLTDVGSFFLELNRTESPTTAYTLGRQGFQLADSGGASIKGNITMGSTAAYGGAISSGAIDIHGNGNVVLQGNSAQAGTAGGALGGGVFVTSSGKFELYNNASFVSRGNYITDGVTWQLQGLYAKGSVLISASADGNVAWYDGFVLERDLEIGSSEEGEKQNQGTVILSGEYVQEDLHAIKQAAGAGDPTFAEMEDSHFYEVRETVNLMQGTLSVVDGATLDANGLTLGAGATLRLEGGSLQVSTGIKAQNGQLIILDDAQVRGSTLTVSGGSVLDVQTTSGMQLDQLTMGADGTLALTVNPQNATDACLKIGAATENCPKFTVTGGALQLTTSGNLTAGDYKLIRVWNEAGLTLSKPTAWTDGANVTGLGDQDTLTWLYEEGPSRGIGYDLVWHIASDQVEPMREAATLTWTGDSGTWHVDEGAEYWTAEVEDTNFHNGDSVIFASGAEVTLSGVVMPADVLANNEEGTAVILSSSNNGQIAGGSKLTKEGAGELQLNLANAYTGGTVLKAGSLVAGHASALGLGDVSLEGGTLELSGLGIANAITATGEAAINGGSTYAGKLTLDGGELTGESLNLAQNADLQSGSISNALTGEGGAVKSTEGSVTLSGENSYAGGTQVQAGTLVAETDTALGSGEVSLAGGTLDLGGHAVANAIAATGVATLNGGGAYAGKLTLDGGSLSGEELHLAELAELKEGSIANNIKSTGGLSKTGNGTVTLLGETVVTQNLVVVMAGTLVLENSLRIEQGGTLTVHNGATVRGNLTGASVILYGGAIDGNVTLGQSGDPQDRLIVSDAGSTVTGSLSMNGGSLYMETMGADSLSVGTLQIAGKSTLILEKELTAYTADTVILSAGSVSGNLTDLELWGHQSLQSRTEYSLAHENGTLILHVTDGAATLEWDANQGTWGLTDSGDEWNTTATDKHYYDGDHVTFEGGNVNLVDRVAPGSVTVQGNTDTTISGDGSISGTAGLIKKGESTLNLSTANDYSGGTRIEGGTLNVGNAKALGTGAIDLAGGTLNLDGKTVSNDINVTGKAALQGASAYTGSLTMKAGSDLTSPDTGIRAAAVTMEGATFEGNLQLVDNNELRVTQGTNAIQGTLQADSLTLESGSSLTLNNATLEVGSVIVQNGATLTSTGATSFTTDHSAVEVGSGSTWTVDTATGQANVTLAEGSTLTGSSGLSIDEGYTLTTGGATINLTGGLTLAEGGKLTLTNDQTIDTTLTLAGGTIDLTNAGLSTETLQLTTGTTSELIVDSTQLVNGKTTLISVTGAITGDGDLSVSGLENVRASYDLAPEQGLVVDKYSATLVWTGDENDTWGTLDAGSATWESADGSELDDTRFFKDDNVIFENSGTVTLQGNVAPGSITVQGEGYTEFTGEGQIVGAASLQKEGEGTLILSTANDYSGGTTLKEGTLVATDAEALGSGKIDLQGGTLSLAMEDHLRNSIYASGGAIEGVEALQHLILYSGSTVQLAEASMQTYALARERTTPTWKLTPNGEKLETAKLNNDGNTATLDGAIALAGGTIKLNGGITLTVTGVSGIEAGSAQTTIDLSDWGNLVYGESGQTLVIFTRGLTLGEEDINKRLATTFSESVADYIREGATWKYVENEEGSGGNLILTLPELKVDSQIAAQLTRNQRNAYHALTAIAADGAAAGALGEIAKSVATQGDINALQATLDQVDGSALVALMGSQIDGNLARLRQLRQSMGSGQQLREKSGLSAYITATNNETRVESDASGDGYRRSAWGATAGLEQKFTGDSLIGAAVSQERARITPSGNNRWHSDTSAIDLYTIQQIGAWESRTGIGASLHRHDTRRNLGGQVAKAANINGSSINIMQELAYTIRLDEESTLQPFAAIESSWNHISSFSEGGVGGLSLNGAAQDAWATDITLGMRYTTRAEVLAGLPEASLSLQSGITASVGDTGSDLSVSYQGAPGYSYEQSAADRNRWGFTFGAGMTLPVSHSSAIYASAGATLRGDSSSFDAQAGLRFQF